uniref:Potassium channel subfamily K member 17-like n=1 Tax=Cyprinodon variegatus TaxID=28743 RepID=A0A3Q2EIT0_CYPVA
MGGKEMLNLARVPSILMLGMVYVAYVLIGGVIFWELEGELGKKDPTPLRNTSNIKNIENSRFPFSLFQFVQDASKAGLSLKTNSTSDGFWKFTSSAVFAATVVTTIGYGNMSPSSTAGQIFCVFFALFGIPLNVVVLNRVGKYMLGYTHYFVHLFFYICGVVLFFIMPMAVFKERENWTYSQAMYYCFITLSTIGFGDFVADSNPDINYPDWYSVLMASWIFFGLAWLALLINHGIENLERFNAFMKKGCFGKKTQEESASTDADNNPDTQVEDEDQTKKPPLPQYRIKYISNSAHW